MFRKPTIQKLLLVGVVLLFFIAYLQYSAYKKTHFHIKQSAFSGVSSWKAFIKLEAEQVSGLGLADHFHLLKPVNKDIQVTGLNRDIKIEKIWLTEGRLYLVYSINLESTDQSIDKLPRLNIRTATFQTKDGNPLNVDLSPMTERQSINFGHAIGHRLYRGLYFNINHISGIKQKQSSIDFYKNVMPKVNALTFKQVSLVSSDKSPYSLQNIHAPVQFISSSKLLETVSINKTYTLEPGIKMKLKQANLFIYGTSISYDLINNKKNQKISQIQMNYYEKNRPYSRNLLMTYPAHHTLSIRPIVSFPYTFTIEPTSYLYQSSKTTTFSVTRKQLDKMKALSKKNGDLLINKNASLKIYMGLSTKKNNLNNQVTLNLRIKLTNEGSSGLSSRNYIRLVKSSLNKNGQPSNHVVNYYGGQGLESMTTLRVTNSQHKDFATAYISGIQIHPNNIMVSVNIDKNELLTAKQLNFDLSPLFNSAKFEHAHPIQVTISNKE